MATAPNITVLDGILVAKLEWVQVQGGGHLADRVPARGPQRPGGRERGGAGAQLRGARAVQVRAQAGGHGAAVGQLAALQRQSQAG